MFNLSIILFHTVISINSYFFFLNVRLRTPFSKMVDEAFFFIFDALPIYNSIVVYPFTNLLSVKSFLNLYYLFAF